MLKNLTLEQVEEIISAAEAWNAKHPSGHSSTKEALDIRAFAEDRKPLVQKISELSHDARMELMALMWIGRDFDGTFDDALKYAYENSHEGDFGYIADKSPALPEYFRKGLAALSTKRE